MDVGGIKINLPKIGSKTDKNKPLANLKEPIKDSFERNDDDVRQATSEFESIKKSDGSNYDFVNKCIFKKLYQDDLIDVDVVKTFKDTKLDLYNMSSIYQMKKDRNDDKFYDKVFKAMDKIPNGKEATGFEQNKFEPKEEFSLLFKPEKMSKIDKFISDNLKKVGKSYKFDANTLDVIEETDAKLEGGLLAQLKTRTFDYRNNTVVNRTEDVTLKGLHLLKQTVRTNDKDGKMVKEEVMTPSAVKGMFDVEVNYANGKKEQIAKSTFDHKSGITTIKKDMTSADGTRTQFLYEDDKQGNRIVDYKITDKNGKILMGNSQSFEVIDDNHFISSKNGYKYDIKTDDNKLTVKNLHTEQEATLDFKKRFKGNKEELTKLLKKVPGEELFETIDCIKKLKGKDKNKVLDSYYSVFTKNINVGDDLMVFLHELGHAKDFATTKKMDILTGEDNKLYSGNKHIQKTYLEECKQFNAKHSDAERDIIDYFIQLKGHYGGEWGGLSETIAETNAVTNTYSDADVEVLGPRMQYLQQHFPKTIAAIRDAMNWKDDLTAIEYYGT